MLQAKNVSLAYDGKQILRDINFEIKNIIRPGMNQGQVISLIGRSGIGKTQLFKIMSGLQEPTSGEIVIHGDKKVKPGDMGVIFQNYYLFEWRTVHTSLLLAAKKNPLLKGKESIWAAAVVHAIGRINFLDDPAQSPLAPFLREAGFRAGSRGYLMRTPPGDAEGAEVRSPRSRVTADA